MTKQICKQRNPLQEIADAVRLLDSLSLPKHTIKGWLKKNTIRFSLDYQQNAFRIAKTWGSKKISFAYTKQLALELKIQNAIDTIKRYSLHIDKLKQGSEEEKQIAINALRVVRRFNTLLDSKQKRKSCWKTRMIELFSSRRRLLSQFTSKIDLTKITFANVTYSKGNPELKWQKEISRLSKTGCTLPEKEKDLFRMKGLSLFQKEKISFASSADMIKKIHETPIQAMWRRKENCSPLSLSQKLSSFPGEMIILKGSFKNSSSSFSLIPIHESFRLTTTSTQTGFPHPSQSFGWGYSEALTALVPYRLDSLTHTSSLLYRQFDTAQELLPYGKKNQIAKMLLLRKEKIFEEKIEQFVQLIETLIMAAFQANHITVKDHFLSSFLQRILSHQNPYRFLSETIHLINNEVHKKPLKALLKIWQEAEEPALLSKDSNTVQSTAIHILSNERSQAVGNLKLLFKEEAIFQFALAYADLVGKSGEAIILQGLSEMLECSPPTLSSFDQTLQASTYLQLNLFINELNNEKTDDTRLFLQMIQSIQNQISLFYGEEVALVEKSVVNELNTYYLERWEDNKTRILRD